MLKNNKNNTVPKQEEEREERSFFQEFKDWLKVIILAFLVAFILTSIVKPTLVIGHSMDNTLHDKDYLLVNRLAYKGDSAPEYKDIVVFNTDLPGHKILIKRVIGEAGDHIKIENGKVYVNDKLLKENYIGGQETIGNNDVVVPEGKIFAMGDNRNNSMDSRFEEVGLVDESQIIGKIMFRIYPLDKIDE